METTETWLCKSCFVCKHSRQSLWLHLKTRHAVHAPKKRLPCLYHQCCFTFPSMSSLGSHLSRCHPVKDRQSVESPDTLCCLLCGVVNCSVQSFLAHLRMHVRQNETVSCPVEKCQFSSNVIGTFNSHFSKKHVAITSQCYKNEYRVNSRDSTCVNDSSTEAATAEDGSELHSDMEGADESILQTECSEISSAEIDRELGLFFLKLESIYGISQTAIQSIISDLNRISHASLSLMQSKIADMFHDCPEDLHKDYLKLMHTEFPLIKLTAGGCTLSTPWRRNKFIEANFAYVHPSEYNLGTLDGRKCIYAYVPFLDVLRNILKIPEVLKHVLQTPNTTDNEYTSYHCGSVFKKNELFSSETFTLQIGLYYDDFEVANPLGTSKGRYKLSAFYWTIANLPHEMRASIDSIQLAVLCRYSHMQHFGVKAVLTHFLNDMSTLETNGIFVDSLGAEIKGTISFVAADNLAAHFLFGMSQSFGPNVDRFCRFCLATRDVALVNMPSHCGEFTPRTPENYAYHVAQVALGIADPAQYGIRHDSVFHEDLKFFHATEGFPPDVSHDILEGIVPYELALCLKVFVEKKYFENTKAVNKLLLDWNFMYTDRINKPQPMSNSALSNKTVGGNATENRTLIRLFPLIFGQHIPADEPCWQLILDLKALVELSFAAALHEGDVAYFENRLKSHYVLFQEVFPEERLKPKHHFVMHYAELTKLFGPLSQYCTLRFESKHLFFKRAVQECKNFKNVCKMLADRHQRFQCYMVASEILFRRTDFVVHNGTYVHLSYSPLFHSLLQVAFPGTDSVLWVTRCKYLGIEYRKDLYVIDGFLCGLPFFSKIYALAADGSQVKLLCVRQLTFFNERLGSYEVDDSDDCCVYSFSDLKDYYPLPAYLVGSRKYVTLKHFVSWRLPSVVC